ncbi:ribonuclease H-like domain-containing protein [Epithele typhae]|uniref:ribonuclease H-like domain-containing protein n=1 Tax=Epithele typhae TaxID=378194 RepID=UPI002008CC0A|nr:ribonuclease H-like domain-containing protein [Epithele typhae]KAH9939788.1 ribonuclease H-like domain-containing protein [Epithele typhae]
MASSSTIASSSFDDYNSQLQAAALKATRAAVSFPTDVPFHRSIHPEFAKEVDACSSRVLSLANQLIALSATSSNARGKGKARLDSQDDVVDDFRSLVVDAMDLVLERADMGLDEALGNIKAPAIAVNPTASTSQRTKKANVPAGRLDPALQHASHLPKPQLLFKRKAENRADSMWTPSLRHKYNAKVPLGHNYSNEGEEAVHSLHPYRYEIKHLSYPSRMFMSIPPIQPDPFDDTPFTWVASPDALASMLEKLRGSSEIAVDLEYHNYRSFGGFVCLMQISTREEDFVVDTLLLREELEDLNEVFTDPSIVKVFHGAESDIVWLQQDFNLYVVNLFDTYHASKVLDFPRHGLASLLEMYCDFTADKRYQLADWRIRPLPEEMLQYARSDTHFLLFIYDNLRNALLDRAVSRSQSRAQSPTSSSTPPPDPSIPPSHALVREVLARSEETALRLYEKEGYDAEGGSGPGGWDGLARKWNKIHFMAVAEAAQMDSARRVQRAAYLAVHAWRDKISREEDESTRYVLPNHYIFTLAENTPADMAALLSVFRPVPPVIRRRAKDLLDAIRGAVKGALASSGQITSSESSDQVVGAMDVDSDKPTIKPPPSITPSSLWSNSEPSHTVSSISAVTSSLFGPSLKRNVMIATQSALVGESLGAGQGASRARFLEATARIHGALVIAPTVPAAVEAKEEPAQSQDGVLKMDVEIAYVPAAQRARGLGAPEDDTIVVVGQAKKKKRKRVVDTDDAGERTEKGKGKLKEEDEQAELPAFDYAAASNILDDGGEDLGAEAPATKKKKGKGKGSSNAAFYGDFPAAPKAHSQVKSGNQSRTFR